MATAERSSFVWDCATHVYDADEIRVRATSLEVFHDSPRLYHGIYVAKTIEREETKALRIGIMTHCALFEPDRFAAEYVVEPKFDKRFKDQKAAYGEWLLANEGKTTADPEEYETVMRIVAAVMNSEEALKYLRCEGPQEQSICWQDEETGLECKSRRDKVIYEGSRRSIVCLKTAQDVSEYGFAGAVANFGYHRKARFYLSGQKHLDGKDWPFVWIAAQNKEPFEVCVYHASDEFLALGEIDRRADMKALAACIETDDWRAEREKGTHLLPPPRYLRYEREWQAA